MADGKIDFNETIADLDTQQGKLKLNWKSLQKAANKSN